MEGEPELHSYTLNIRRLIYVSIPVTLTFEQATGKNVLLLPMGSSTDAAHSINEKLDKRNYIEGIKLLGAYLHYVAEEPIVD